MRTREGKLRWAILALYLFTFPLFLILALTMRDYLPSNRTALTASALAVGAVIGAALLLAGRLAGLSHLDRHLAVWGIAGSSAATCLFTWLGNAQLAPQEEYRVVLPVLGREVIPGRRTVGYRIIIPDRTCPRCQPVKIVMPPIRGRREWKLYTPRKCISMQLRRGAFGGERIVRRLPVTCPAPGFDKLVQFWAPAAR